jgi:hypothetical protein
MAPSGTPARTNSWTAWRSSILSILRGPPVSGQGSLPGGQNVRDGCPGEDRI